jgi:Rho GTPase-activating protein 1
MSYASKFERPRGRDGKCTLHQGNSLTRAGTLRLYLTLPNIACVFCFWLMLYICSTKYSDLLHDVSLRSDTNRMDAFNLAIVICPNLVRSSNPMRDVMMCTVPVPGMSTPSQTTSTATLAQLQSLPVREGKTSLGTVIALCIRRYYEIFDEAMDRHEAVAPWRAIRSHGSGADGSSSASGSPKQPNYVLGDGDDEDIDDETLVMSVGIENNLQLHPSASSGLPSAWESIPQPHKRHKSTLSNGNDAPSIYNDSSCSVYNGPQRSSHPHTGNGKAKSMVSVEGSGHSGSYGSGGTRRGSITIGRSTTRKGSGAAVEAVSVVAGGFFTSPTSGPKPTTHSRLEEHDKSAPEDEVKVLTVGERRRMFEGGT